MVRLVVGAVVRLPRSLVGDVPMADPPILIDFGDNNPDDWDRNPRPDQLALPIDLPPSTPPAHTSPPYAPRGRPVDTVETKEDLL